VDTQRDAVSATTRKLLDDSARRAELGAAARVIVERDYGAARMSAAYEAIYDELE
jgi:glycosyltransferase involved in cell wall biosynthesis